ncbi:UDP-glucose 4-epimerase GalE [Thermoproteota archaeon]
MILIVGGAGYIGSHVNKMLTKQGYQTIVYDNLSYGHKEFVKWGEFINGDLADIQALRNCFKTHKIEAVMHFSAFTYVGESVENPAIYYQNNVVNTLNLLNVMCEFNVVNFIFSSSCAVYGVPKQLPLTEDHDKAPVNPYGRTKLMIEQIAEDFDCAYGLKSVFLRYFNAAGADPDGEIGERHDPESHLIPLTIYAALGKRADIKVFGTDYPTPDGTCVRDYIHVNDLADAHIRALEYLKKERNSNCFNLGNNQGFSVREIINTVKAVTGKEFTVIEAPRREGDPPVLVGSFEKANEVLGWKPKFTDIKDIVSTAWDWHLKHQ